MKAKFFRGAADTQQRDPVTADKAVFAQVLQRVPLAVMPGHHPQAGGAAVHCVGLLGEGERHGFVALNYKEIPSSLLFTTLSNLIFCLLFFLKV